MTEKQRYLLLQDIACQRCKVKTLREALTRIVKHLETLDDPSATISSIAEEALKETE